MHESREPAESEAEHEDGYDYRQDRGDNAERSERQSSPDELINKAAKAGNKEEAKEYAAAHVEMELAPFDRSGMTVQPKPASETLSSTSKALSRRLLVPSIRA